MSPGEGHDLSACYEAYKLSTNCFLGWMVAQYHSEVPGDMTENPITSTRDIVRIARVLEKSQCAVPPSVIGPLRHAITKRWEVLEIYKTFDADDANHTFFIKRRVILMEQFNTGLTTVTRLEETLRILTPLMANSKNPRHPAIPGIDTGTLNTFATLASIQEEADIDASPVLPTPPKLHTARHSRSAKRKGKAVVQKPSCELEDDEMSRIFEVASILHEIGKLRAQVMQIWIEAGKGTIPIPAAAWLTNIAFGLIKTMIEGYFPVSSSDFENTCIKVGKFLDVQPDVDSETDGLKDPVRFCDFSSFIRSYPSIPSGNDNHSVFNLDDLVIQRDPHEPHRHKTEAGEIDQEHLFGVLEILQNTHTTLTQKRAVERLELCVEGSAGRWGPSEPILPDIQGFFNHPDQPASTKLVFGIDLLLTTYDAFRWPEGKLNKQDARIRALQLAMEMRASVRTTTNILKTSLVGPTTDGFIDDMEELYGALNDYVSEKRFDLYYRAPWTAGAHMVEMLHKSQRMAKVLVSYSGIIPATLHLYNALRRSAFQLPKIPVMDELCQLFKANIFLHHLPDRNFLSIFRRAVYGGALIKGCSRRRLKNAGSKIEIGVNREAVVAELKSTFGQQSAGNHHVSLITLAHVYEESDQLPFDHVRRDKLAKKNEAERTPEFLKRATKRIMEEFEGPTPSARINYFAIFDLCLEVLEDFDRIIETSPMIPELKFSPHIEIPAVRGVAMADLVLAHVVEGSRTKRSRLKLPTLTWPVLSSRAFNVVDKNATLSQFLWDV
ncbi:hypothetical protein CORC01_02716 [Colletotrichum orchidophilum]|uniref:DUF6604 domain-containing protein n=1 Tax=Colletotrichum orchidophilum TaxID=1209926 RepID=A0A1G4BKL6_9PEZI|nr:uncharacterized protein CORC01_02716 [Colletotrichum orchidophilum]OHF01838.1 hypothetical protein CORC01_02716 [Colletotrichum orchidophilum]